MRLAAALLAVATAACGPKVAPTGSAFDEDLPKERTTEAAPVVIEAPRPEAPPGKGLRNGTIERAQLIAVLDGGPGNFLRQLEITPRMDGRRFIGWQLVQLIDHTGPLHDVDVVPGDVLLAVNGKPLSRPDQLQSVWDSLRTANELRAQLWRGEAKLELAFAIEPKVDPSTIPPPVAKPAPAPAKGPPVQLAPSK
jgi:S1-C subfamily serine protease